MSNRQRGFTLIELLIVVAIIAIIAAIAIPNLLSARLNANETSAISTLRNLSSAQAQFQASATCDVDGDGTGEFGFFRELSGATGVRTAPDGSTTAPVRGPTVLSGAFRTISAEGQVSRSGYIFRLLLPSSSGIVGEMAVAAPFNATVVTDLAETTWCAYAWPANYGNSGNRTFFVNQAGDITSTDSPSYSGPNVLGSAFVMSGGAAFEWGSPFTTITGKVAVGTLGTDGHRWRQVN